MFCFFKGAVWIHILARFAIGGDHQTDVGFHLTVNFKMVVITSSGSIAAPMYGTLELRGMPAFIDARNKLIAAVCWIG
jgi:hypothetical protein